jgi:hypothetical protein
LTTHARTENSRDFATALANEKLYHEEELLLSTTSRRLLEDSVALCRVLAQQAFEHHSSL